MPELLKISLTLTIVKNELYKLGSELSSASSTVGQVSALHMADPESVSGTTYVFPHPTGMMLRVVPKPK